MYYLANREGRLCISAPPPHPSRDDGKLCHPSMFLSFSYMCGFKGGNSEIKIEEMIRTMKIRKEYIIELNVFSKSA
jgi:hypothetical protein